MSTASLPSRAAYTTEPIYRFSVNQWHDLIASGTLSADDPVELIEGVPVFKRPKNPPHAIATGLLGDILLSMLPFNWHIRLQEPVTLTDGEPEPDLVIAQGRRVDYALAHPGAEHIGLLIEVADTTLDRDRGMKLRSYARAGIGCYWIVNLNDRRIEAYTAPKLTDDGPQYGQSESFGLGDEIPLVLDGKKVARVAVVDVLPPG